MNEEKQKEIIIEHINDLFNSDKHSLVRFDYEAEWSEPKAMPDRRHIETVKLNIIFDTL